MKLKNKFRMAYDICLENRKRFFIHIAAALVFFVTLLFLVYMIVSTENYRYRVSRGLKCDIEKLCYASVSEAIDYEASVEIYEEISRIKGVADFGNISTDVYNVSECLLFLKEIQEGHENGTVDDNGIETIVMDAGVWPMMNINLVEGSSPDEIGFNDAVKDIILYLSEKYRGTANVEDVYEACGSDGKVIYRYVVGGFFDEYSACIDPYVFNEIVLNNAGSYSLEYGIIEVMKYGNLNGGFFTYEDVNAYEEIAAEILKISEKYDVTIDTYKISSIIDYVEKDTKNQTLVLRMALIIFAAVMIISLCVSQIYSIITKSADYGIRLSNGVTKRDMTGIIFMQNILQTAIPAAAGCAASYCVLKMFFETDAASGNLINYVFTRYCIPGAVIFAVGTVVLSSVLPAVLMRKTTVLNLLNGRVME